MSSDQPAQPKWAWWVVGIAIPLLAIAVPILVNQWTSSPSPPTGNASSSSPTSASPSSASSSSASPTTVDATDAERTCDKWDTVESVNAPIERPSGTKVRPHIKAKDASLCAWCYLTDEGKERTKDVSCVLTDQASETSYVARSEESGGSDALVMTKPLDGRQAGVCGHRFTVKAVYVLDGKRYEAPWEKPYRLGC